MEVAELSTSEILMRHLRVNEKPRKPLKTLDFPEFAGFFMSGEDGIRTHAPLRTNGFQDRLVMTTSIPLQ